MEKTKTITQKTTQKSSQKSTVKGTVKSTVKSSEKIMELVKIVEPLSVALRQLSLRASQERGASLSSYYQDKCGKTNLKKCGNFGVLEIKVNFKSVL
ncbi:hypothetical protein IJG44_01665 [bacterium]|nr:hypothetical protein [bacterium]